MTEDTTTETICPPDHSHGDTSTCRALHHCKCDDCRRGAREYEFWRQAQIRRGRPLLLNAVGTHRRIHALQAIGYSQKTITGMLGRSEPWLTGLLRNKKVKPQTARLIADLYDRCAMNPPTPTTKDQRAGVTRAKRYAERMGWAPPLAWDEESLDDPNAEPAEGWARPHEDPAPGFLSRRDPTIIEAAIAGDKPDLSPLERRDVVAQLHALRWSGRRVAEWIDCNVKTVERVRAKLELPAWGADEIVAVDAA